MSRLAAYLDILRQTQAEEVKVVSGEPVAVRIPGRGAAKGGAPVSSATILALAEELLSAEELHQLTPAESRCLTHEHAGIEYLIEIIREGIDLTISLRPAQEPIRASVVGGTQGRAAPARGAAVAATGGREASLPAANESAPTRPRANLFVTQDDLRLGEPPPSSGPAKGVGDGNPSNTPTLGAVPAVSGANPGARRRVDELLGIMLDKGASDLHLSAETQPILRVDGEIHYLEGQAKLSSQDIHSMVLEIMSDKAQREFAELRDADCAYELGGTARFRVNVFEDHKGVGAVLRQIPIKVISAEELGLPKACIDLCHLSKGLVVVTGPTGSGKSTTLAAMIDYINKHRSDHIITIEDPIEFVHPNIKCLVNQREVGTHTKSFKAALRAALREDPDIVLVGEMRDLETIAIAIETAETGHLVFGTLHTTTATSTVDRMIDQFPADRQAQIRVMLSESLKGVIAQVLCKKKGGGRVAAHEVLLGSTAVSALIRDGKTFQLPNVMQTSKGQGMVTMNDALFSLVQRELIEPKEAFMKAVDKAGLVAQFRGAGLPTSFGQG